MPTPKLVAEYDDGLRVLAEGRIGGNQAAADQRRYAKVGGRTGCQIVPGHIFGKIFRGGEVPPILAHYAFDRACLADLLPALSCSTRCTLRSGSLYGIRIHQDTVNHAEYGSGGADAQRQRKDGGEREAGALPQLPEGEHSIL